MVAAFHANTGVFKRTAWHQREIGDISRMFPGWELCVPIHVKLVALKSFLLIANELSDKLRAYQEPRFDGYISRLTDSGSLPN